jgi:hypothetical protein
MSTVLQVLASAPTSAILAGPVLTAAIATLTPRRD